jgi:hypothetical protein
MLVKIIKNKTVVDANDQFTYIIECHHGDKVDRTIAKIPANAYMLPDETASNIATNDQILKAWLLQLTFEYDDIDIDNYTTMIEEI